MYATAIIGGGAAGLMLATKLLKKFDGNNIILFERGERVGRKLSATGNGQGNITNLHVTEGGYFSSNPDGVARANQIISAYDNQSLDNFFSDLGVILTADDRGRVYPASRQASSLTDALRFYLAARGADIATGTLVTGIEKKGDGFVIRYKKTDSSNNFYCQAKTVVLCTGGTAAKNFGSDGSGYALARSFGHTVTELYPSLVQLKTDTTPIKGLKGIRVNDAKLTAYTPNGKKSVVGDVIFTEYGVSGDAVFRLTPYIAGKNLEGTKLEIDFLPQIDEGEIAKKLTYKTAEFSVSAQDAFYGIINNQIGRAILRITGNLNQSAALIKRFPLQVTGSLGFDYAQVTKGGVPLSEVDKNLQSRFADGLYFAGEILDVDGECGGYNLQWAYSSACTVAAAIGSEFKK